jgi:hypothetical protein
MAIHHELCETCRFYQPMPLGRCARYPAAQPKQPWDWCGEHQRDAARVCRTEGPPVELDEANRLMEQALHRIRGVRGDKTPREPLRAACLRAQGHEGKHANYVQEWE